MSTQKPNSSEFAARIMAVQACYEMLHTKRPLKILINEYLERGLEIDTESFQEQGVTVNTKAHKALFKKIILTLNEQLGNVEEILEAHVKKKEDKKKEIEPLLKAIALCGICEILAHQEYDTAIIIDDYLNVTHGFYEQNQVSFLNGILDSVGGLLRTP